MFYALNHYLLFLNMYDVSVHSIISLGGFTTAMVPGCFGLCAVVNGRERFHVFILVVFKR